MDAFNVGNAEEIDEPYHEDAVNHQITQDPVEGREKIRQLRYSKGNLLRLKWSVFQ